MRGADITQEELFSYRTLEERVPKDHPLRKFWAVVDLLLTRMDSELDALYAKTGRESMPPGWLLRASLAAGLVLHPLRTATGPADRLQSAVSLVCRVVDGCRSVGLLHL
jgi:hypothetical protein